MARGTFSKGALALASSGVRQRAIADIKAVDQKTVSRWLSGESPAPSDLLDVIAELADEATARRVAEAIGAQR